MMLFIHKTSNPIAHKDAASMALRCLELMLMNACQHTRLYVLHIQYLDLYPLTQ